MHLPWAFTHVLVQPPVGLRLPNLFALPRGPPSEWPFCSPLRGDTQSFHRPRETSWLTVKAAYGEKGPESKFTYHILNIYAALK